MASVALEVTAVRHADRSQGAASAMGPKNPVSRLMAGVPKQARDVPIRSTTMLNCSFSGMVTERNHVRRFGWERDF